MGWDSQAGMGGGEINSVPFNKGGGSLCLEVPSVLGDLLSAWGGVPVTPDPSPNLPERGQLGVGVYFICHCIYMPLANKPVESKAASAASLRVGKLRRGSEPKFGDKSPATRAPGSAGAGPCQAVGADNGRSVWDSPSPR